MIPPFYVWEGEEYKNSCKICQKLNPKVKTID